MNSSVKFLLPTVIVGFACGFAEATAAVPPKTIATPNEIANAAFAALRVCFRIMGTPSSLDGLGLRTSLWDRGLSRRGRPCYKSQNSRRREGERRDPQRRG